MVFWVILRRDMKKYQTCFLMAIIAVLVLLQISDAIADASKVDIIDKKMADISAVHKVITQKNMRITAMRKQFREQMRELKTEIKNEKRKLKITSYQKAMEHPRIAYNFKLIQQLLINIAKCDEKIKYLQNGIDTLEFFYNYADDNLKILEIIDDIQINELLSKINKTLAEYMSEIDKMDFYPDPILHNPEKIWKDIMNRR